MTLEVVGAGFGRTGTLSLKLALERLGFVRCHHMREVVPSGRQIDAWLARARGEPVDWDRVFEGFRASCDWPSSAYWEELHEHFPQARVILSVRDAERWYESTASTIYRVSTELLSGWLLWIPRLRRLHEMIMTTVWNGVFDGRFEDREHAIRVFRENTEHVRRVVPPERLLVFEAKDGWEPLCAFLGVPVPPDPYPHVNEASFIQRALRVGRVVRWLPALLAAAAVAVAVSRLS